ncbi:MAG: FtsX-like permease family protein [Pirellulales bacterium]
MKRWIYYLSLAWKDVLRLWRATYHQIVIVTGICLPILLLLGLKHGHVEELRKELVRSPSGRQIVFWAAQKGELLTQSMLEELGNEIPGSPTIIPETQRVVKFGRPVVKSDAGKPQDEESQLVTLYSTYENDPILQQFDVEPPTGKDRSIIVSTATAKKFGLNPGDSVDLVLSRKREQVEESHPVSVRVKSVLPLEGESGLSGYAHADLLSNIELYVRGGAVPSLSLPAMKGLSAPDLYGSYLVFCQKGAQTQLSQDDVDFLAERAVRCTEISDPELKSLYGLFNADRLGELVVYLLQPNPTEDRSIAAMKISPMYISENTKAIDDFVFRWNPPLDCSLDNKPVRVIGLTLPTVEQAGGWLREYVRPDVRAFEYEESQSNAYQVHIKGSKPATVAKLLCGTTTVPVVYAETPAAPENQSGTDTAASATSSTTQLEKVETVKPQTADRDPQKEASGSTSADQDKTGDADKADSSSKNKDQEQLAKPKLEIATVPTNLAAWLTSAHSGKITFDAQSGVFIATPDPIAYDKARLYTATIDDVPNAVKELSDRRYAVMSESTRISEIHSQDNSLQTLVLLVGAGVFSFGVFTVVNVLVDATDRKRGTIGILRVMGMSGGGVFFVVVLRAVIVGVFAAVLSLILGLLLIVVVHPEAADSRTSWLSFLPAVSIKLSSIDFLIVSAGCLLCSGLGAIFPAWRASRLDPFDAIVEGKFH